MTVYCRVMSGYRVCVWLLGRWATLVGLKQISAADDTTPEMSSLCRLQSVTVLDTLLCHKTSTSEYLLIEIVCVCFFYVLLPSVC
jgi:hypothetical protein